MGRVVLVQKIFKRKRDYQSTGYCADIRWESVEAEGRPGWVVGERWIQEGTLCFSQFDLEREPIWDRKPRVSIHCLLVCYWPTLKPVRIPFDGYEFAKDNVKPYPPVQPRWDEECRARVAEEMKEWPRDAAGRWVKKNDQGRNREVHS